MNIRHNPAVGRFEAEFSTDFQGDLAAVKAAGFRCDGPPSWVWYTVKLSVLNKLRENKPASGLSINEDAYAAYMCLVEMEKVNEAARAQFAPIKEEQEKVKKARKKQEIKDRVYHKVEIPKKPDSPYPYDYIGKEDLPPMPPRDITPIPPHAGPFCVYCRAPVYFYEKQDPPTCLWCDKQLFDPFAECA